MKEKEHDYALKVLVMRKSPIIDENGAKSVTSMVTTATIITTIITTITITTITVTAIIITAITITVTAIIITTNNNHNNPSYLMILTKIRL